MVTLIHIVGRQGSGKSGLARLISNGLHAERLRVRVLDTDEAPYFPNGAIREQFKGIYDFVIVEAEELNARHQDLQEADKVLQLSVRTLL